MTKIMTNVSSLTGQKFLTRNMASLQQSLTRLSTGLKINSGADDPAGLISSEILRSEITGIKTAIKNTERANGMIATADSALNEVSKLLNDIRGLVTEAANTGGMSYDMIAANQLQVNASLDAIDRIAASTSYMGGNLLDGTLDFQTTGIDRYGLQSMNVRQVSFPDNGQPVNVSVEVVKAAAQASLYYNSAATADAINLSWGGNYGYQMQTFEKGTNVQQIADVVNKTTNSTGVVADVGNDAIAGRLYISNMGNGNDLIIESGSKGLAAGCVDIKFLTGSAEGILVKYQESLGAGSPASLSVYLQTEAWKAATAASLVTADPAGVRQNSALDFTAAIAGSQYNGSSINIVDGILAHAGFRTDAGNVSGVGDMPFSLYSETAVQAKALMGNVNGLKVYQDHLGNYISGYTTLTAKNGGADLNNVDIKYQGTIDPNILRGRDAVAVYDKDTKNYTIYVNQTKATAGDVNFADIVEAVRSEGTFSMTLSGIAGTTTFGTANFSTPGTPGIIGNTSNSGGDAGTLFIYAAVSNDISAYSEIPLALPPVISNPTTGLNGMQLTVDNYLNYGSDVPPVQGPPSSFQLNIVDSATLPPIPPFVGPVEARYNAVTGVMTVGIDTTALPAVTYDDVKTAVDAVAGAWGPANTFTLNLTATQTGVVPIPIPAANIGTLAIPKTWAAITNAEQNAAGWANLRAVFPAVTGVPTGANGKQLTVVTYPNAYSAYPPVVPGLPSSFGLSIFAGGAGVGETASYNPATGIMTVIIDETAGGSTYALVKAAVDGCSYTHLGPPANPALNIPAGTFSLNLGTAAPAALVGADLGTWAGVAPADLTAAGWDAFAKRAVVPNTAEQVRNVFDLSNTASHGSEAAASIFNVEMSIDNDGTGRVYAQTFTGNKGFKNGITGGSVISTGNDVVTALNNSLYWNSIMCEDLMSRLYTDNAAGKFYDRTNPPPVISRLATGQHGLGAVSTFSEVAYYGSPTAGTGIQFLGGTNSPSIRFVTGAAGSGLSLDLSTLAPTLEYAQAVLSGVNQNSSLVITAKRKGGEYDDVQFVYRQAATLMDYTVAPPVPATPQSPASGWAEYDPGETFSAAQCNFKDVANGNNISPSFIITANERGDMHNNVGIRMNTVALQDEKVVVKFNTITNTLDISLGMLAVTAPPAPPAPHLGITLQDVIDAVNAADIGFTATPSFAIDAEMNTDMELVNVAHVVTPALGLSNVFMALGNTGDSGGHNGQVTVWMAEGEDALHAAEHINQHSVIGGMFTAQTYTPVGHAIDPSNPTSNDARKIDYVRNERIVTSGGQLDPGTIIVKLATDASGNSSTTAAQFVAWWQTLTEAQRGGISTSLVREPGANWDDICADDTAGKGLLKPTIIAGECDTTINNDIRFVGWYDDCDEPYAYEPAYAKGVMTSQAGEGASYTLTARRLGPDYNGYTIRYLEDAYVTGKFDDNIPTGKLDECGNVVYTAYMTQEGLYLELNQITKEITIHMKSGVTTAADIKQLIENEPLTKNLFTVALTDGIGAGLVLLTDDTLKTVNGSYPPGENYNGAKLLFGSDAENFNLVFRSQNYGSDQFVDVQGLILNGKGTVFTLTDANGAVKERTYGEDVFARINGVKATAHGLNISLNTQALSLTFTFGSQVQEGYNSNFQILGGGATFQIGPKVVTSQQISIAFRNLNTVQLGGQSGRLYELREGNECDLFSDTFRAYRIIEEAIIDITTMRGALGSLQKTTLDTNLNVLNDTLESILTAESVVRDTDFAEETANLTRAQILAQANIQALSIANQIPNYVLRLLGG